MLHEKQDQLMIYVDTDLNNVTAYNKMLLQKSNCINHKFFYQISSMCSLTIKFNRFKLL